MLTTLDPGQSYAAQSKTEQTLDLYGNVTQSKLYGYGNLSTPDTVDTSVTVRGNRTHSWTMAGGKSFWYETTGIVYKTAEDTGPWTSVSPSAATNYSLPGVLTPNDNGNLATSISYSASFGVTQVTGPNGATATTVPDIHGRPQDDAGRVRADDQGAGRPETGTVRRRFRWRRRRTRRAPARHWGRCGGRRCRTRRGRRRCGPLTRTTGVDER